MHSYGVEHIKRRSRGLFALRLGLVAGGALVLLCRGNVHAADTQIGVSICGQNSPGASITIDQPIDDSVVNQPSIVVRATVNNTSQVTVEVDGQYSGTVAIGNNQTFFQTPLMLEQGTHTISMTANDICGSQDATDEVVITYTPDATQPSSGNTTPTEVEGGGVVINPEGTVVTEPVAENDFVRQIEQLPVIGGAVSMVGDFAAAIGLESTVVGNNTPAVAGVARVGLTVAALTSVVMASSLAPVAAQAVPGISEAFNVTSHRSMIYLGWIIRGVGVLTMAIVYFL